MEENDPLPSAHERWTLLRIDLSRETMRMWVDGRLVGELQRPRYLSGDVELSLPDGSELRRLEIYRARGNNWLFLPLDLSGYYNASAPEGETLPEGFVVVK